MLLEWCERAFCACLQCWLKNTRTTATTFGQPQVRRWQVPHEHMFPCHACFSCLTFRLCMTYSQFQHSIWRPEHVSNFVSSHQLYPPNFDVIIFFSFARWLCHLKLCHWRPFCNRWLRSTTLWLSSSPSVLHFVWSCRPWPDRRWKIMCRRSKPIWTMQLRFTNLFCSWRSEMLS